MWKMLVAGMIVVMMLSGCSQKVVTEYVAVPAPVWEFQKLKSSVQGKLEVQVKSKEEQRVCTPYVVEATDKLYSVIDALEGQFDSYRVEMEKYNARIESGSKREE